ncbi:MAG: amylo-alpha-1,6-glucosidase [Oscillatoriophycideae cyanobacterium NC_groundwater_1537_Pr4_S-0.65um_50_18]|nr:amylo-alpha-1,6-glucosidase [Oscillatoriophycideae cyanobacterium NC_groundwater_1537_Pr4_S-0.65um_50_18]
MQDIIELNGRVFVPAEQLPISEWACPSPTDQSHVTLTLKDDDLFLITDTLGNISGCLGNGSIDSMGLFGRDTRFLSRSELQIEGRLPVLLSSNAHKGFALSVLCANPRIDDDRIPAETIGIQREIALNGGLFEETTLTNYSTRTMKFELSLSFDADFMDLFEIRGFSRKGKGRLLRRVVADPSAKQVIDAKGEFLIDSPDIATEVALSPPVLYSTPAELTMGYQGLDGDVMESHIQFLYRLPDLFKGYTAVWQLELEPHTTERIGYRLETLTNSRPVSKVNAPLTLMQAKAAESQEEEEWRNSITQIRSNDRAFNQVIERAEHDIYLLRQTFEQSKILSAGVPWFCTLFGRDSIISASQTLILDPAIARETLTVLAQYQGKVDDEWKEEEPGKILHELRLGEMARCHEIPHTPYYGTVDATPLWIMLYAEYYAWTYDQATLDKLWDSALAAMSWIDRNMQKTGYLSYDRRSERGLMNQGWKDSGDCIVYRDGTQAKGPITLCEVQGYVYAAKIRLSEIARLKKRIDLADRWQEEARQLKIRFNRDFWVADLDFCALALDGEGKQVDSITSNPGHCLNLGIFLPERAKSVAERLHAPDMFNGWGIRTLSSLSPAYNPMGYHVGSVWPHDNGMTTLGLRSLGHVEQALEVSQGLIDMTMHQPYQRPPELFCGYERDHIEPVRYPVACSPQAWATGTIFQLIQVMVNLVPDAPGNHLRIIDPALPASIEHLSLKNFRVGSTLVDLEFVREGDSPEERSESATACRVVRKRGNLRVVIEA